MTTQEGLIFAAMVFIAILLLAMAMIVPTAGSAAQASRAMRQRIGRHLDTQAPGTTSLLRERYLKDLTPFQRMLEDLPLVRSLSEAVEQSGLDTRAYRVVGLGLLIATVVGVVAAMLSGLLLVGIIMPSSPSSGLSCLFSLFIMRIIRLEHF